MIIRSAFIVSLLTLLALVLYIPSATPPERFIEVLRQEHGVNQEVWGTATAYRILDRMLNLIGGAQKMSSTPVAAPAVLMPTPVDAAMTAHMGQMNTRLFNNAYFRSIDTLLLLATFRIAALIEAIPLLFSFAAVCGIDGLVVRRVKGKEFIQHNPELLAIAACTSIVLLCGVAIALVVPYVITPHYLVGPLLVAAFTASRAVSNFHRRG